MSVGNSWDCFGDDELYDDAALEEALSAARAVQLRRSLAALRDAPGASGGTAGAAGSTQSDQADVDAPIASSAAAAPTERRGAALTRPAGAATEATCAVKPELGRSPRHQARYETTGAGRLCSKDSIGPERSEGPTVAPRTLLQAASKCVHRGNTPAQSDISTIREAPAASHLGSDDPQVRGLGCGTLGLASDGTTVALDPFGSRARLRDAPHGDDGSPGNGRVGVIVELGTAPS